MSRSQRDKGARVERQAAKRFSEWCGRPVKRELDQPREGGIDLRPPIFDVECKARARVAALRWYEQACAAVPLSKVPLVVVKEDRGPLMALLSLDDLLHLVSAPVQTQIRIDGTVVGHGPTYPDAMQHAMETHP